MKSAYEIAMARLEKESGPAQKLTNDQKAEIAEIDRRCDAKMAEQKLAFGPKIASAESLEDLKMLKATLADELATLEAEREKAKGVVWNAQ